MQLGKQRCTWQHDIKMDQITQERCKYSGIAKYFVIHEFVIYWSYQLIKLEFMVNMCYKVKRRNLAQIEGVKSREMALAVYWITKIETDFLISNFRRVLNVVCFLLGNPPASEFYLPMFRNTLSVPPS
jgi:hypothetical protein